MTWLEAKLVIPSMPNKGGKIAPAEYARRLEAIEYFIGSTFGGFTVVDGRGVWCDGTKDIYEPVRIYTIAYESSVALCAAMDTGRDTIKERLDQKAVYLSHTVLTGPAIT
ncbi:hypothetical protein LCGC14_0288520 [marine sediment metagenome]|uniref:Uncharacterized protein n=1 Tax=marine sediment metagenome TaxID=412755 RepID=A0A0F9TTN2_9ZZZZ